MALASTVLCDCTSLTCIRVPAEDECHYKQKNSETQENATFYP